MTTPIPVASHAHLSGLIVPVDVAEPVVQPLREKLDPAAVRGVPAHVTVLFPFVPPDELGVDTYSEVESVLQTMQPFDCVFRTTRWFRDDVLWLAPEPNTGFHALTAALCEAFPRYLPYRGAHPTPIPHLTVGDRSGGASVDELLAAEREVLPRLPIVARVDAVHLMVGSDRPRSWHVAREFGLYDSVTT
jgi:2'-5' RNA ligase superfamily